LKKRGDLVLVAVPGDYGKPRPALVVQSDLFNETHASVSVAPITSTVIDAPIFRITVEPSLKNGLKVISQIMIDKIAAVRRERLGSAIGHIEDESLIRATRALAIWFGIGA
jgi:mRNA interferase MazF